MKNLKLELVWHIQSFNIRPETFDTFGFTVDQENDDISISHLIALDEVINSLWESKFVSNDRSSLRDDAPLEVQESTFGIFTHPMPESL